MKRKEIKVAEQKKMCQTGYGLAGGFLIRVTKRKARRKMSPSLLLRCGCCNERVEIYYEDDFLEINGVNGSIANWRKILLPLLGIKL